MIDFLRTNYPAIAALAIIGGIVWRIVRFGVRRDRQLNDALEAIKNGQATLADLIHHKNEDHEKIFKSIETVERYTLELDKRLALIERK